VKAQANSENLTPTADSDVEVEKAEKPNGTNDVGGVGVQNPPGEREGKKRDDSGDNPPWELNL
jgi:hypothetical protein